MSIPLRVFICLSGIGFIYISRKASIAKKMTEKQSLFWIFGGLFIFMFGLFPKLVFIISDIFSVEYPPSIIFTISFMFVFYGIFSCYKTNAKRTAQVNELAMQISLLNDENMQLKSFINEHYLNNEKKDVENLIV